MFVLRVKKKTLEVRFSISGLKLRSVISQRQK